MTTVGPINHQEIDTEGGVASTATAATLQENITTEAAARANADNEITAKMGAFQSYQWYNADVTLSAGVAGGIVQLWGTGTFTTTLPLASEVPIGQTITIYTNGHPYILSSQGPDTLFLNGGNASPLTLPPWDSTILISRGAGEWDVIASTGRGTGGAFTVSTLPPGVAGMRTIVTDASSPTFLSPVTGGGSIRCPVFYDDAQAKWIVG